MSGRGNGLPNLWCQSVVWLRECCEFSPPPRGSSPSLLYAKRLGPDTRERGCWDPDFPPPYVQSPLVL
jgi:hypothetical protein